MQNSEDRIQETGVRMQETGSQNAGDGSQNTGVGYRIREKEIGRFNHGSKGSDEFQGSGRFGRKGA